MKHARVAVSTRARHCWRANHAAQDGRYCTARSFNPRPPLLAGESTPLPDTNWLSTRFQSAPAIAGGRIIQSMESLTGTRLFQSAPAIAGGRIEAGKRLAAIRIVSIRARHCWRANPPCAMAARSAIAVSIRARHCWRANQKIVFLRRPVKWFQSAPAIAGGRIKAMAGAYVGPLMVSIRARHCWRANRQGFPLESHHER